MTDIIKDKHTAHGGLTLSGSQLSVDWVHCLTQRRRIAVWAAADWAANGNW